MAGSWRQKVLGPKQSQAGESTDSGQLSPVHARTQRILVKIVDGARLGLPGEEHLRAMVARKARDQLYRLPEEKLVQFLDLLATLCKAAVTGEGFEQLMEEAEIDADDQGEPGGTEERSLREESTPAGSDRQARPGRARSAVG